MCAFAIERSKGVFFLQQRLSFQIRTAQRREQKWVALWQQANQPSLRSSTCLHAMVTGQLYRKRKQKIARRKRTHELLEHAAKTPKSADVIVHAQPRSVSA
jgi:hypothetical protein